MKVRFPLLVNAVQAITIALLAWNDAAGQSFQGAGYPVWPLSTSNGAIFADMTVVPHPTVSDIANAPTSQGGTGVGFDCCGNFRFYVMHTGSTASHELKMFSSTGLIQLVDAALQPLTSDFNGCRGDNEIQVVPMPDSCDQYIIIYSMYKADGVKAGYYIESELLYSRIRYTGTGPAVVYEKDVPILAAGAPRTYTRGKAVSRTGPNGDLLSHYLYACRRSTNSSSLSVDRFIIKNSPPYVSFDANTGDVASSMWYLTVIGSNIELSPDESRLAVVNRNDLCENTAYPQIYFFPTGTGLFNASNVQKIYLYDCILKDVLGGASDVSTVSDNANYQYLVNFPRKISGIQFSPSGRYLWIAAGGYVNSGYSNLTYLGQVDLWSNGGQMPYDLRLRVQHPCSPTTTGDVTPSSGIGPSYGTYPEYRLLANLQAAYDGNVYFSKRNSGALWVIPQAQLDAPLTTNLVTQSTLNTVRPDIDFATAATPNIPLSAGGSTVFAEMFPDQIDGFNYHSTTLSGVTVTGVPVLQYPGSGPTQAYVTVGTAQQLTGLPAGGQWETPWGTVVDQNYTVSATTQPGSYLCTYAVLIGGDTCRYPVSVNVLKSGLPCHGMYFISYSGCEYEVVFTNSNPANELVHDLHIIPNASSLGVNFSVTSLPPGWSKTNAGNDRLDLVCPTGIAPMQTVSGIRFTATPACAKIYISWMTSTHGSPVDTIVCTGTDSLECQLPCAQPPRTMGAWWPLDDQSGTAIDEIWATPAHLTGVRTASGVSSIDGMVDKAFFFLGGKGSVIGSAADKLNPGTHPFAIDFWIRTEWEPTTDGTLLRKITVYSPTNARGYALRMHLSGRIILDLVDGVANSYMSSHAFNDGKWHHFAVAVKRPNFGVQFYFDGVPEPLQTTPALSPLVDLSSTDPFEFGSVESGARTFRGAIDELEYFSTVSDSDIKAIFDAGGCGKCPPVVTLDSLCGFKFNDLNGNGKPEGQEPGIAGWPITMYPIGGGAPITVVTDADGHYCFYDVPAGTYTISEQDLPGWTQTLPAGNGSFTVTIPSPAYPNLVFCNTPDRDKVCGAKYNDANANGQYDAGEDWLEGWTFSLNAASGGNMQQATSNANGEFCFDVVSTMLYTLVEFPQNFWTQTQPAGAYQTVNPIAQNQALLFGNTFTPPDGNDVCGEKFADANGNGVRDQGEAGLSGWTFTLTPAGGGTALQAISDVNGVFCFNNVPAGTYTLAEVPKPGWEQTTPASGGTYTVWVPLDENHGAFVFGNKKRGSKVCGYKFNDYNGNGFRDADEPYLPGWHFYLSTLNPFQQFEAVSDANGHFCFDNVPDGQYTLTEQPLLNVSGWVQTVPTASYYSVVVVAGKKIPVYVFGNQFRICGEKFNDLDGDGIRDAGEPGLQGWTFQLTPSSGVPMLATSNAQGKYCFSGVRDGNYILTEMTQGGWTCTHPAGASYTVHVPSMLPIGFGLFGNTRTGTDDVCGYKFADYDGDGKPESGEDHMGGWSITLTPSTGAPITVTTDANGEFCFTDLPPGTYTLSEQQQPGWTQTQPSGGGVYTLTIPLPSAAQQFVFGNKPDSNKVCGWKYRDVNHNRQHDPGEPFLADWWFVLTPVGGGQTITTNSDATGQFCFPSVPNGTYTLTELHVQGWSTLQPASGSYTVTVPGTAQLFFFGNDSSDRVCEVCGVKYNDANANGVQDASELGIPGWTILLTPVGGGAPLHVSTDAQGVYCFWNVPAGQYVVSEVQQSGWTQTYPGGNGTHTITAPVVPWRFFDFGNTKSESCDDVLQGSALPNPFECTYSFAVTSPLVSPIVSASFTITGGSLADLTIDGCAAFTPPLVDLITLGTATVTFGTPCSPPFTGAISVFPNVPDGVVSVSVTFTHADQTVCTDQFSWRCCLPTGPCDTLVADPFFEYDLQHDSHRFTIINRVSSPITYVEIALNPALPTGGGCSGNHDGGDLVDDGTYNGNFYFPFTRIPSPPNTQLVSGMHTVSFNIGIDWFCEAWHNGIITFIVHHADGTICPLQYGPIMIDNPVLARVASVAPPGRRMYASHFSIKNADAARKMRYVGIAVENPQDQLFAVSATTFRGAAVDAQYEKLALVQQSKTMAVFELSTPARPGASTQHINVVVARDSNHVGIPVLRISTFDEGGNALFTDTVSSTTAVQGEPRFALPEDLALLGCFPNPARGEATINFALGHGMRIRLEICNALGEVAELVTEGYLDSGVHAVRHRTNELPPGPYYLRLSANGKHVSLPIVVVK